MEESTSKILDELYLFLKVEKNNPFFRHFFKARMQSQNFHKLVIKNIPNKMLGMAIFRDKTDIVQYSS